MSTAAFLTHRTDGGPMMALDLTTIPESLKTRIIQAANLVGVHVGNGDITATAEVKGADDALEDLAKALGELEPLHELVLHDFGFVSPAFGFNVIRDGNVAMVQANQLTPIERHAAIQMLRARSAEATLHADELEMLQRAPQAEDSATKN